MKGTCERICKFCHFTIIIIITITSVDSNVTYFTGTHVFLTRRVGGMICNNLMDI